jgi:hypothetical protein
MPSFILAADLKAWAKAIWKELGDMNNIDNQGYFDNFYLYNDNYNIAISCLSREQRTTLGLF